MTMHTITKDIKRTLADAGFNRSDFRVRAIGPGAFVDSELLSSQFMTDIVVSRLSDAGFNVSRSDEFSFLTVDYNKTVS